MKQNNNAEKIPSLTLYVVFSILVIIIYTIVEQILSTVSGVNHDTLTTCFYACFGGEILACALIKIFKIKESNKYIDLEFEDDEDGRVFPMYKG